MKPVEVNVKFPCPLKTTKSDKFLMFSGNTKGNIDPKLVKQRQYRQE